jgi:16S rRNA (uracil1498-N3)-methyltransferase
MSDRFYVESSIGGDSATLTGQEAVHVRRVLRARVGDRIQLFDGSGCEFAAQITELRKETVHCAILERQPHERELARPLVMGVALPKGERQRVLVEKLTELGVTALVPLITERSIVQPDEQTVSRLQRAVIEACKQCGRLRLMQIHFPQTLPEFLQAPDHAGVRLIAHPRADGTPAPGRGGRSHGCHRP